MGRRAKEEKNGDSRFGRGALEKEGTGWNKLGRKLEKRGCGIFKGKRRTKEGREMKKGDASCSAVPSRGDTFLKANASSEKFRDCGIGQCVFGGL